MKALNEKIANRSAHVCVIGLGYVGLPLAVAFAVAGYRVTGIDTDIDRTAEINDGQSPVQDVSSEELRRVVEAGRLTATTDFDVLQDVDTVSICVPTPLRKTKDPDISYIISVTGEICRHLHRDQLIVLESTTYPGTTDEVIQPTLEGTGLKLGQDFGLAFSPERIDPSNSAYQLTNTPKIIGGVTPACTQAAKLLYEQIIETVVTVSSCRAAEMVKLLENTFRAVNIGLVNEVALMCNRLNLDVWEIIEAASTKPFGFMPFYPGPGLGGHCIPLDPHYLAWKLRTLDYRARFIELADDINTNMPHHVVTRVADGLNERRKSINGSRLLVLGVAYKADTNDLRESPALEVIRLLQDKGGELYFHDPYIAEVDIAGLQYTELNDRVLSWADCVVITTNHTCYDYAQIVEHAQMVVDSRNATRDVVIGREKIYKL
ncbi:MAG: UDP-N-acetyl-D-glucosamine dehydrogenase [Candidatus Entotheonella gemina]|uniref:UDP-N-acetyl-D-glucosamine dehydrogenase n=1 Tax=Candidatus Entotheonella gemina TaxID=1429439 RepID=W4M7R8_9BACT|nr:MAG: UDP-N-acetyl-D-glucosamine dehydrogenase [Candidatus Entotheonella gemina]